MAKNIRKKKKESHSKKEGILSMVKDKPEGITAGQLGLAIGSYALGSLTASVIGKHTGIPGIIIGGAGVLTRNLYLTSLGAGLYLSAGVKAAQEQGLVGTDEDDLEGLDMEKIKGRAKEYFRMLGKKLYLPVGDPPPPAEGTGGLNGDENVTYFVNPYTQKQDTVNLTELDKISSQIADMNRPVSGMGEYEEMERNF